MSPALRKLVERQMTQPVHPRIAGYAEQALERWPYAAAILFYGSARREPDNPEKEPDFYVLFDRLDESGQQGFARLANAALPPNVRFLKGRDGGFAKCAVMTVRAFERHAARAFATVIWGRFGQACALAYVRDAETQRRLTVAGAEAAARMLSAAAPLVGDPSDAETLWVTALQESYATELRAEGPGRARQLFDADRAHYEAVTRAWLQAGPRIGPRAAAKRRWALRRVWGKTRSALHVAKAAFTVREGGLDYVLDKLSRHSGVTLTPTEWQRSHPRLAAPALAWSLWRRGAFR